MEAGVGDVRKYIKGQIKKLSKEKEKEREYSFKIMGNDGVELRDDGKLLRDLGGRSIELSVKDVKPMDESQKL
jgi:hypothetical protein